MQGELTTPLAVMGSRHYPHEESHKQNLVEFHAALLTLVATHHM